MIDPVKLKERPKIENFLHIFKGYFLDKIEGLN